MLQRRTCPYCGAISLLPEELLGDLNRCEKCFQVLDEAIVSSTNSTHATLTNQEGLVATAATEVATLTPGDVQTLSIEKSAKKSRTKQVLIISVLLFGFVFLWFLLTALGVKIHYEYQSDRMDKRSSSEMTQLDSALQQFMSTYQAQQSPPSQIKICRNYSSYLDPKTGQFLSTLDQDSVAYLQKTIGRNSPKFTAKWQSAQGIQWTPNMPTGGYEILEGHQCLVFFLGGLCTQDGSQFNCQGFSSDPSNPDVPPTMGSGIGPFYSFNPNRLAIPPGKTYFPAYHDPYGMRPTGNVQFYAYFSSYKHQNGYNRYRTDGSLTHPQGGVVASTAPIASDCASLGVWPYASAPAVSKTGAPQYVRPQDWQIVCAGLDGVFGPGTDLSGAAGIAPYYWNSATAAQIPAAGADDRANFATGKLQSWP
jgi:hypothetical protein